MRSERRRARALRKQRLLAQSRRLREEFAQQARPYVPWFQRADHLRAGLHWLAARPAIPVAIVTALLVARPRVALGWLGRGWAAWQLYRQLQGAPAAATPAAGVLGWLGGLWQRLR